MVQAALGPDDATRPVRYVFDEGHHLFDAADSAFSAHLTGSEPFIARKNPEYASGSDYHQLMRLEEWLGVEDAPGDSGDPA